MATGILLLLIGAWLVLRTVVPGQDRNLVDLILGKKAPDPAAGDTSQDQAPAPNNQAPPQRPPTSPGFNRPTTSTGKVLP
jgi:hypothetical protein